MREKCFCGREGKLSDREPVFTTEWRWVLRCPNEACGHLDDLSWLPGEAALIVWGEARHRRENPQEVA